MEQHHTQSGSAGRDGVALGDLLQRPWQWSRRGVFAAERPAFATWTRLGTGLPMAPVLHLEYSAADRVLLAATMGRGAWTLTLPEPVIV